MHNKYYGLVNKILPINCEAYLKNKGWIEKAKIGNQAKVFGKTTEDGFLSEVLVPTSTSFKDCLSIIYNLLTDLQNFEGRPLESIGNDMILSNFDVFRIVAFKGDTTASLPLEDAATLLNKSVNMMAAAAQSIITPSSYFQSRHSNEVKEFLSKLRMGHTERGSFIVTLQTPIAPDMRLPGIIEPTIENEPFERQVTTRLCSLITNATTLVTEPNGERLVQSVASGMSANFFEALADIANVCGNIGANMDMAWASVRPINHDWSIPDRFIVKRELVDSLREAGRTLRTTMPENNVQIKGYVFSLQRPAREESGTIKIHDIQSNPTRIVSIDLSKEDYEIALNAHKESKILAVTGNLTKNGRTQNLRNASNLQIVDLNELSPEYITE